MAFRPFDVNVPHIVYACLGGFVVLFGMFSLFIREKLYIGEAIWAFLFGVVIGPYGGNIFNPRSWSSDNDSISDDITLEVTRFVLAIGVFAIGVELPKQYMKRHWKSLFFLLAPVMTWGWFVSAGIIYALVPALNFLSSLAIAACLTPTDPILAAAVVGGKYADKHVPAHLRHLLAAESGCNDGAAFPFLFIALYLVIDSTDGHAIEDWFLITWLYEVVLGVVLGAIIGFGFRHLMKFCERKDLIDRQSYVAQYVSLAMFTIGVTTLLGSDDLLAAFASGTAFAWDGFFNKQTEQSVFSSVIDLLFNVSAFVYIGAWMPFSEFNSSDLSLTVWRLIIIAILVLLLRRLPAIMALYRWIPDVKTFTEAVFSGHFGPMGVGAVFISTLAKTRLPPPQSPPADQVELLAASIQPIVAFMVLCSIVTHGLSIPSFSLGRRVHSVSRTWSRHTSIDPLPDWTAQTRRVTRPEDIIINRDSDLMERGEASNEKRNPVSPADSERYTADEKTEVAALSTPASADKDEATGTDEDKGLTDMKNGDREARPDNPPDGTPDENSIVEWQEGPHLVIERHAPGQEAEVEVVRNVFHRPEKPEGSMPDHNAGNIAEKGIDTGRQGPSKSEDTVGQTNSKSELKTGLGGEPEIDEEDGWRDVEEDDVTPNSPQQRRTVVKFTTGANKIGKKRRDSFRRSLLGKAARSQRHQDQPPGQDTEGPLRGRKPPVIPMIHRSASRARVQTVKTDALYTGREGSPVRSIRWSDLPVSSRGVIPAPETLGSSRPSTPDGPRVQFDLPEPSYAARR